MNLHSKILVTGHRGLVGSAVVRHLVREGFTQVITVDKNGNHCPPNFKAAGRFDLRDKDNTKWLFSCYEPEYVFHCAARVGGIKGNAENQRAMLTDNLDIQNNVLLNAADYKVSKLVFLGSSCIYPRECAQPIREDYLLNGPLEVTNEGYALAKITGVKLCQYLRQERGCNFVSAMPCNMFGPNDKFDGHGGHVIPGMMARMHAAKVAGASQFVVWGDGTARRELMHADDLARALHCIMDQYDRPEPINAGSGYELTMAEIAEELKSVIAFKGQIVFDASQPSGTQRKVLDSSKLRALGWQPFWAAMFRRQLAETYEHYLSTL
jgi:GDP-L-fucose synthase